MKQYRGSEILEREIFLLINFENLKEKNQHTFSAFLTFSIVMASLTARHTVLDKIKHNI